MDIIALKDDETLWRISVERGIARSRQWRQNGAVIYFDYNATTPVLPEVFEAMRPYFCDEWGNPSSAYRFGSKLKPLVGTARKQVAELIGALPEEILFTSCATESNNAAIQSVLKSNPAKRHIITSAVEHSSVLNQCQALEKEGYRVTYLPVDRDGFPNRAVEFNGLNVLLSDYIT